MWIHLLLLNGLRIDWPIVLFQPNLITKICNYNAIYSSLNIVIYVPRKLMNICFFLWKEHVSCHFVFHYLRADFDRFRFKICFYELSPYNFWVSTYLHTFKSLPSFVTNYEILIGTQMKIFCLRTTTKLFLELCAMVASMRSKNCFVHQKPSTIVQKSTIESVHYGNTGSGVFKRGVQN